MLEYGREMRGHESLGIDVSDDADHGLVERNSMREYEQRVTAAELQKETLNQVEGATMAWLGYFFELGIGTPRQRLERAASGVTDASEAMASIVIRLEALAEETTRADVVAGWASVVSKWGEALQLIAQGALNDDQRSVNQGYQAMVDGSGRAESIVDIVRLGEMAAEPLKALENLNPDAKVPQKAIESAKEPWRKAIALAGTPMNWFSAG